MPLGKPQMWWPGIRRSLGGDFNLRYGWPQWENDGRYVNDAASGLAMDTFTFASANPWESGPIGSGINFADQADIISSASAPHLPEVSFAALARLNSGIGTAFRFIASHHTTNGVGSDWGIYFDSSNILRIDIPWILASVVIGTTAVPDTTELHTFGFTRSGVPGDWTWRLYLDGDLDGTATTATNPNTGSHRYNWATTDGTDGGHSGLCTIYGMMVFEGVAEESMFKALQADFFLPFRPDFTRRTAILSAGVSTGHAGGLVSSIPLKSKLQGLVA